MEEFTINTFSHETRVYCERGILNHIGKWIRRIDTPPVVVVVADEAVAKLYGDIALRSLAAAGLRTALHTFPAGDASKNLEQLDAIYRTLGEHHVSRDGMLLALGGGVTSDLTGFAAATWMRGVRYANCPTTLEADVDASVGGKTAINHASGKNMVGAFHHPEIVAVDPDCLATLPARDLSAGMAESVKHALIRDASFLDWHDANAEAILAADPDVLTPLVVRNLRIKAAVVEEDETEQGVRAILNFGHTIGHAIEKWFQYGLRHGEAVSLGMVAAAHISHAVSLLSEAGLMRVVKTLERFNLPVRSPKPLDVDAILALTHGDKKVKNNRRLWVLLDGIGATTTRDDLDENTIREAVEYLH